MHPRVRLREQRGGVGPKPFLAGGGVDGCLQIVKPRNDPGDICFDDRHRLIECESRHRVCRVTPYARQLPYRFVFRRELAPVFRDNSDCGPAEVSSARIITEPLPCMEDLRLRRRGQRAKIRKPPHPFIEVGDNGRDLGLLQHEFGHEDRVGICCPAPGQIAGVFPIPKSKAAPEGGGGNPVHWRETSNSLRSGQAVPVCPFGAMTSYTHALTTEQAEKLRTLLKERGFAFAERPYTLFFAQKNKLSVAVYEKGPKILLQGKGIEEFVQFELEPKILGEAKLGYEEVHSPEMFEPHFGIDESGKGDFFGPLVIAGVYVDRDIARKFLEAGIQDSKRIGSDARIHALADIIRSTPGAIGDAVAIGPERYNDLYEKFGNLNSLLGWGHARVIENLLERKPDCPRALSDKFADASVIQKALLQHGQKIQLEQRTKAESDLAVAAASILAREAFIDWLDRRGKALGVKLGRGVSGDVKETARKVVENGGPAALRQVAKVHFRTAYEVAPDHYSAPAPRRAWRK